MPFLAVDFSFNRRNVQETVRHVGDVDLRGTQLGLPEKKIQEIMDQFPDPHDRAEAYINYFIDHDPLASWRRFIFALDDLDLKKVADCIRHLAEPISGKMPGYYPVYIILYIKEGHLFII